jgi:hypothetical protein
VLPGEIPHPDPEREGRDDGGDNQLSGADPFQRRRVPLRVDYVRRVAVRRRRLAVLDEMDFRLVITWPHFTESASVGHRSLAHWRTAREERHISFLWRQMTGRAAAARVERRDLSL